MASSALLILLYHRVLAEPDPLCAGDVDVKTFERHIESLVRYCNVKPLADALDRLYAGTLPPRTVCITFDDGYADNYARALPILRAQRLPATFFVSTGFLGGGCMWNDAVIETVRRTRGPVLDLRALGLGEHPIHTLSLRVRTVDALIGRLRYQPFALRREQVAALREVAGTALPTDLMMSPEQVRGLVEVGMEVGAHTVSHPILAQLDDAMAEREIVVGKEQLESIAGRRVRIFAYPNGRPGRDYGWRHVEMVRRAGFARAVSTHRGPARRDSDPWQLPRFAPWDRSMARFLVRLVQCRFQPSYREPIEVSAAT